MLLCVSLSNVSVGGENIHIPLGAWLLCRKSHVTLMYFPEILSTYVYVSFQLWLCKYLDISVTLVYILSSNWAVLEGILPSSLLCC